MRERHLVRLFLHRLLDHELVSPQADRRAVLSMTVGLLVAASLFLAVVLAVKYQFNQYMPPGLTTTFSLDDRALFVSLSLIVLALVAVAEWDALALDPRDTAVLGVLPIPRGVVVRAKCLAAVLFGGAFALALNLPPTVLRAAALPERLPITMVGVLWLTLGHGIATLMAGAFGFLAVLGLRETLGFVLGSHGLGRASAVVQAMLVVGLSTALLLLPGSYGGASRWLTEGRVSQGVNPVAWFVGLHEAVAGSVIDGLPRSTPPRLQAAAEGVARAEYQRLRPRFPVLARVAVLALVVVALIAVVGCAWNGRHWPLPPITRSRQRGALARVGRWLIVHVIARRPAVQAGFFFTVHTVFRQAAHRTTLAASVAVGLALVVVLASAAGPTFTGDRTATPLTILASQTVWLAAVLGGFRHSARLPSQLTGTMTLRLAWSGDTGPYVAGVKRAGWVALVLPALAVAGVWHTIVLGSAAAIWHGVVGIAVAALLVESLFYRYRGLPFGSSYVPTDTIKPGLLFLVPGVIVAALALAWLERAALATSSGAAAFVGALIAASFALHVLHAKCHNNDGLEVDASLEEDAPRLALSE